ncbi:MAG: hypothetical protein ABL958_21280 [Bdellovibrionia bacterium]
MTPEHGIWIVFGVSTLLALWGPRFIWRTLGFKLAIDSAAIGLLGFGGATPTGGLRVMALMVLAVGTLLLFLVLVLAHQFFRARMNE